MSTPTIPAGNLYMNIALYTGNTPSTNAITGLGFAPDLVWTKSRSAAESHNLVNSVCGNNLRLRSNQTDAEASATFTLDSNGFTVGANSESNTGSMVGWAWKAGGAAVTNNAGSISSQVSANTTSGFSIVTYTGNGVASTIGHGLGVAPSMVIVKSRSTAPSDWNIYHSSLGATKVIYLDLTDAAGTNSSYWSNTAPTSSVFTVGNNNYTNGSGTNFVAYCWSQIAGFSAFGSYTGNGSTDGPFVYTGFRPRFIMIKCSNTTGNWQMWDLGASTSNVVNNLLYSNLSNAETSASATGDALSNGFKLRQNDSDNNGSGNTYIYMAFAENPLKFANAR